MICPKCKKEIADELKFCPDCGADLSVLGKAKEVADEFFDQTEKEVGSAIQEVANEFNGTHQAGAQRLKDDRGLVSYILLSIITCGIYSCYFIYKMAKDVNIACDGDGEKTAGLVAFILLSFITCGIYALFWYYNLGNRLAANAHRYQMTFQENGTTVLLWLIFGSVLCGIGLFVAMYILIKNSNRICYAYNKANGLA